jgi:hypothetical protein
MRRKHLDYTPKCFKTEEYTEKNRICKACPLNKKCGESKSEKKW